jgi:sulfite exporter TauE/SafE
MTVVFASMFLLGLATSLHCVGMCGPMVVTYAVEGTEGGSWTRKLLMNTTYQGTKIASYVIGGVLLGTIGSAFNLDALRPWVTFAAGAFMIVLGLGMTGRVPWAARLSPRPPKFLVRALTGLRRKADADAVGGESSLATPAAFGLLTGLMPCAPLQGAQIAAVATGSALLGGTAMLAFGLGTMPLTLLFGMTASLIPGGWKQRLNVVLAAVVIVFGLSFINRGAMLVGSPVTFDTVRVALLGAGKTATADQFKTAADGVVEVHVALLDDKYVPESVVIPANRPVHLMVKRQEGDCAHDGMCASGLVIARLGVDAALKELATTKVDLPPTPAGTYSMTSPCGMMSGTIVAK